MNTHTALKNTETNGVLIVKADEGQKLLAQYSNVLIKATGQDLEDGGCSDQIFTDCGLKRPEKVVEVEATEKETPNLTNLTAKNK